MSFRERAVVAHQAQTHFEGLALLSHLLCIGYPAAQMCVTFKLRIFGAKLRAPAGRQNNACPQSHQQADNSALYLDLALPSDRTKLADPELYLSDYEYRLAILD